MKNKLIFFSFFLFLLPMSELRAKVNGEKSPTIWLECSYKLREKIESEKFIIDAKNKTVENPSNGTLYNVTSFQDDRLMFEFNYEDEKLRVQYIISRKTGAFYYTLDSGEQSWVFNGSCKKISPPKPIF